MSPEGERCAVCQQPISAHSVEQAIACERFQVEALRRQKAGQK